MVRRMWSFWRGWVGGMIGGGCFRDWCRGGSSFGGRRGSGRGVARWAQIFRTWREYVTSVWMSCYFLGGGKSILCRVVHGSLILGRCYLEQLDLAAHASLYNWVTEKTLHKSLSSGQSPFSPWLAHPIPMSSTTFLSQYLPSEAMQI